MSIWLSHGKLRATKADNGGVKLSATMAHTPGVIMGNHAAKAEFSEIANRGEAPSLLTLSSQQAQQLADDLYLCGFRPSVDHSDAATQRHIADLREHIADLRRLLGKLV